MLSNKGVAEPKVNPAPGETMKLQWHFPFWADVLSSLGKTVESKAKENRTFPHRRPRNLGFTSEFGAQKFHLLCQHQYQNNRELVTPFSAGFTVNSGF